MIRCRGCQHDIFPQFLQQGLCPHCRANDPESVYLGEQRAQRLVAASARRVVRGAFRLVDDRRKCGPCVVIQPARGGS